MKKPGLGISPVGKTRKGSPSSIFKNLKVTHEDSKEKKKSIVHLRGASTTKISQMMNKGLSPVKKQIMKLPTAPVPTVPKEVKNVKIYDLKDVEFSTLIGQGAFGKVRKCLVTLPPIINQVKTKYSKNSTQSSSDEIANRKLMAVKILSKYQLIKDKQEQHLLNELKNITKLSHPFILDLKAVSQEKRFVFMYMDYLPAGDLMKVINKFQRLDVTKSRFYFGQVVLAFQYLHGKDMIYRDVKPENILIAPNGFIKLADFGFLKTVPKG